MKDEIKKEPFISINVVGITDYIREKDMEIANLKNWLRYSESESSFYKSKYNGLHDKVQKVLEIYENSNSIKYKRKRFMEDKTTADLIYELFK